MAEKILLGNIKGPQGEKGDTGAAGPMGPTGDPGAQGSPGVDGKSAYQYAQDGGYTGTEEEFATKLISDYLPLTGGEVTGPITANEGLFVGQSDGEAGHGLALYGGHPATSYGVLFGKTDKFGTHGTATDPWATYLTMDGEKRGWIFRAGTLDKNVASIGTDGTLSLDGSADITGTVKEGGTPLSEKYAAVDHTHETTESNAFAKVIVGSTTLEADSATDTLYLVAGTNVTLTADSTNDKVTIAAKDTTYGTATTSAAGLMSSSDKSKLDGIASWANAYSHPTTSGNKHIPSGGSSGQILRWSADGTAAWGADNNTTYSAATTSAAGLMSASDKSKLDNITASADSVSFSRSLTSGTKIGTITINGTGTDLYCQTNTDTNTTYSAGTGISLSGTTFSNSGVRSIATGSSNGTISVNTNGTSADVAVKGLGSAAYTASTAYAAASHTHSGYASSSHTHAASAVTAGTFAGQVVANSSGQTYSTSLLRNSKLVSSETNPSVNGEICWTYE